MDPRLPKQDPNQPVYQALAEFRHQLRKFLQASEYAVHGAGLHPQQHQLLLAVAGAPASVFPSIAYAADVLGLKHNSVVELADRCEKDNLLGRRIDPHDRRRVWLQVTAHGRKVLHGLTRAHMQELDSLAPHLIEALQVVLENEVHAARIFLARKDA